MQVIIIIATIQLISYLTCYSHWPLKFAIQLSRRSKLEQVSPLFAKYLDSLGSFIYYDNIFVLWVNGHSSDSPLELSISIPLLAKLELELSKAVAGFAGIIYPAKYLNSIVLGISHHNVPSILVDSYSLGLAKLPFLRSFGPKSEQTFARICIDDLNAMVISIGND